MEQRTNNTNDNADPTDIIKLPAKQAVVKHNVLSTAHMNLLYKRTPQRYVHERRGKGGGNFKYVTGAYVKSQLNRFFGYDWSFKIVEFTVKGNQAIVFGRLTGNLRNEQGELVTTLTREQFGRADIKTLKSDRTKALDFGNDLKAAATDALKKCASDLGIARDVYAADEYRELVFEDEADEKAQEQAKKTAKYEDKMTEVDSNLGDLEELNNDEGNNENDSNS